MPRRHQDKRVAVRVALLFLFLPHAAVSQGKIEDQLEDDEPIIMQLVLVDEHDYGDAGAVMMSVTIHERVENVILLREDGAGPEIIALAGLELLRALEARGIGAALDEPIAVSVDADHVGRPVPPWAEHAWRLMPKAGIGVIPGVGAYPVLPYGLPAHMIRAERAPGPGDGAFRRWNLEPGWTLRSGSLAVVGEAAVAAGIRVERPARTAAYSLDEVKVPWLFHESLGELELPVGDGRAAAIVSLHPMATGEDDWILLWGEAAPPGDWVGPWPPFVSSELWLSERGPDGWTQPRNLVSAGQVMLEHGSTMRHAPDGTPLLMLPTAEAPSVTGPGPILFGSPMDTLRAIPVPGSLSPYQGSFAARPDGVVEAVVLHEVDEDGVWVLQLLHLITQDLGRSWSAPSVIASWSRGRSVPADLSVHLDSAKSLHVLWSPNQGPGTPAVRHLVRRPGSEEWEEADAPGDHGALLRWSIGADRQGCLTMVQELLMPTAVSLTGLQSFRWSPDSGWSEPDAVMPGSQAGELFDGLGVEGEWTVGWTGIPAEDMPRYRNAPPVFSVYVWAP